MIKELKMNSRANAELVFHLGRIASGEGLDRVCIHFVPGKPMVAKGSVTAAAAR